MNKGTSLHEDEDKRRGGKVDLSGHRNTVGPLCSLTCASGGTPACACSAGAEPDRAWSHSRADLHMATSSFVT